jgi:TPP-dependent pyruvate/acetoin dehydrogenase alpha subunit
METRTPVHLGIGQEAVAVGVSAHLNDAEIGSTAATAGTPTIWQCTRLCAVIMAEVLGRATGASGGMGGSMHLYAPEFGIPRLGSDRRSDDRRSPSAPAIACKMDGQGQVAVCYFGDGACEEGVLHESLNLARVMNLPVLFVCENNFYSSHLEIHLQATQQQRGALRRSALGRPPRRRRQRRPSGLRQPRPI